MEHLNNFVPSPVEEDTESTSDLELSQSEALLVPCQAVCTYFYYKLLKVTIKMLTLPRNRHFFTTFIVTLEGLPNKDVSYTQATQNLNDILASWKFERVEVEGDGNCLFSAISPAITNGI